MLETAETAISSQPDSSQVKGKDRTEPGALEKVKVRDENMFVCSKLLKKGTEAGALEEEVIRHGKIFLLKILENEPGRKR